MENNLIIIFSRAPIPGQIKKRLAKDIGNKAALSIHNKLFSQTLKIVQETAIGYKLYLSQQPGNNPSMSYELQNGKDLGEKMANAIQSELTGFNKVCLIGSDCINLETSDLQKAFTLLDKNDLVFGPATDGGYYLIGMNQSHPTLFDDMNWGSASVLTESLSIAKDLKLRVGLLNTRQDVDTIDDLPTDWLPK